MSAPIRLLLALFLAVLNSCTPPITRLNLREIGKNGSVQDYYQDFDECYYATTPAGNLNIVMRCQAPSTIDPTQTITQVVHLHCFWHPRPGVSYAEQSMINGYICYMIQTGQAAVSYEGGMFASFNIDRKNRRTTGRLESSQLKPLRRRAGAKDPFGVAFAKGTFVASEHPRRVTAILNQMDRLLGPQPEYRPPKTRFVR